MRAIIQAGLRGPKGETGPSGPAGVAGPVGPAGPPTDPAELAGKVDKAGDTMTGALEITHDGTPLVVNNTQSALIGPNLAPTAPLNDTGAWTFGTGWDYVDGKMVADSTTENGGPEAKIQFTMTGLEVGATYSVQVAIDPSDPDATVQGEVFLNGVDTGSWYWVYVNEGEVLYYTTGFKAPAETVVFALDTWTYTAIGTVVEGIQAYRVDTSENCGTVFSATTPEAAFSLRAYGDSIAIGDGALPALAKMWGTTAIGRNALHDATFETRNNTAIGTYAMQGRSGGSCYTNVAIGAGAFSSPTPDGSGSGCVVVGAWALPSLTTGHSNEAIGSSSGHRITTGYYNTNIGIGSGSNVTTGLGNVVVGAYSGQKFGTSSARNVVIGSETLKGYTPQATPVNNLTAVGYQALSTGTLYDNTTGLGYQANVTGANQVQLGNSATTVYAYGAVQNRSDMRDKTAIRDTALGLDFIMALRPVDFKWDMREDYRVEPPQDDAPPERDIGRPGSRRPVDPAKAAQDAAREEGNKLKNITKNGSKTRQRYHHGLIAQEVEAVIAATGVDFGGFQRHDLAGGDDVKSIGYTELIGPMIKAIQQQQATILALQARLDAANL